MKIAGLGRRFVSMYFPMALCAVRYEGDPNDGGGSDGGGGESWFGSGEGLGEGVADTLGAFENQNAAFDALHQSRQPLVDRVISSDPELEGSREKLSEFDSPEKLAKSYVELQKKLGSNPITPLAEDASDDQKAEFTKQLNDLRGVPEAAGDYKPEIPEDISKNLDQDKFGARLQQFHEAGFSPDQVQAALNIFFEEAGYVSSKSDEVFNGWKEETDQWAKETWGADADGNKELAERAMQKFGVLDLFKSTGLINQKGLVDSFYQLAAGIGEGELPSGGGQSGDLSAQLKSLKANPAYNNPRLRVGENANIMQQVMDIQGQIAAQKK